MLVKKRLFSIVVEVFFSFRNERGLSLVPQKKKVNILFRSEERREKNDNH
jgi:hypothetical protein